jgi:hypothetical protein
MTEHLNQAIDAEAVDLPSHEIADPGLRHSEKLGGGDLRKSLRLDQFGQLNHQIGSNFQVFRLVFAEPEIAEYVSA